jgi:hypothetical protein
MPKTDELRQGFVNAIWLFSAYVRQYFVTLFGTTSSGYRVIFWISSWIPA